MPAVCRLACRLSIIQALQGLLGWPCAAWNPPSPQGLTRSGLHAQDLQQPGSAVLVQQPSVKAFFAHLREVRDDVVHAVQAQPGPQPAAGACACVRTRNRCVGSASGAPINAAHLLRVISGACRLPARQLLLCNGWCVVLIGTIPCTCLLPQSIICLLIARQLHRALLRFYLVFIKVKLLQNSVSFSIEQVNI